MNHLSERDDSTLWLTENEYEVCVLLKSKKREILTFLSKISIYLFLFQDNRAQRHQYGYLTYEKKSVHNILMGIYKQ